MNMAKPRIPCAPASAPKGRPPSTWLHEQLEVERSQIASREETADSLRTGTALATLTPDADERLPWEIVPLLP